jgi:L-seryl-tRNA(Ser) seleniumtransferase
MSQTRDRLRDLPSIDRLLSSPQGQALVGRFSRQHVVRLCRQVLDEVRTAVRQDAALPAARLQDESILHALQVRLLSSSEPHLMHVVNATGTVLHTNLGRAVLSRQAIDAVATAAGHTVNLEYDLERGERGRRENAVEALLLDLTGAEAATVVNNNAGAVLLALNTLGEGKEVIVSRGELIEIGGAFRIPEIMAKSGAVLREVGTTNRTHPADYEQAINDRTAALLKVHTSNYRVVGFSSAVDLPELVAIGRARNIPVIEDLGSGALVDLSRYGLPKEPVVSERVALGADLITFSGDKVLGGPQAGLIVGRRTWLQQIASNPLHRALRAGKLTLAALEATLRTYQQATDVIDQIPTLKALARSAEDLRAAGDRVLPALQRALGPQYALSLEESTAQIGSGALPTEEIASTVIAVRRSDMGPEQIAARFRAARPPIIGRIRNDRFLLDLRTVANPADLIPVWADEG